MKTIYWRPQTTSPRALFVIGIAAVVGLASLCSMKSPAGGNTRTKELAAAYLAEKCMQSLKARRQQLGHKMDERFDPHHTGMIGEPISASTSKVANLSAKQVSVNPNFGAAVVRMLVEAGVQPGDTVAIGWTGSFPALNVALSAAVEGMDLKPIAVASALSSQYGANKDDFLWLDMEHHLAAAGLIGFRSSAMTVGGAADRAFRSSDNSADVVRDAHERTEVPWLKARKLHESIDSRVDLYSRHARGQPIAAYINVGGGIASMGGEDSADYLRAGVNRRIPSADKMPDCVVKRFAAAGQPVIHLAHARTLAERYGLSTDLEQLPTAGTGPAFDRSVPSRAYAGLLLVGIGLLLHAFVTRDYGYRVAHRLVLLFTSRPIKKRNEFRVVAEPVVSQLMV